MTTAAITNAPARSKGLHIALWVFQVLLALLFLFSGGMKLVTPIETLQEKMTWIHSAFLPRFIGISEVLGAIGLILPSALRIQPKLTGFAAIGLAIIMVLAVIVHIATGDGAHAPGPVVFFLMAAFVAWGRLVKAPIAPR